MQTGIGFYGLLTIVLIVLKLCGVIQWGWWLVLLPLYGGAVLGLLILGLFLLISGWVAWTWKGEGLRK